MAKDRPDEVHIDNFMADVGRWLCCGWRRLNCRYYWRCMLPKYAKKKYPWAEVWSWTSGHGAPVFALVPWLLTDHLVACRRDLRR